MLALLKRIWNWPWEWPYAPEAVAIKESVQKALNIDSLKWKRPASDDMIDLLEEQCLWIQAHSRCCYCDGDLYGGPRGGASQNMYCGNVDTCNSAFNLSSMIPWGQFIGGVPEHFKEWRRADSTKEQQFLDQDREEKGLNG